MPDTSWLRRIRRANKRRRQAFHSDPDSNSQSRTIILILIRKRCTLKLVSQRCITGLAAAWAWWIWNRVASTLFLPLLLRLRLQLRLLLLLLLLPSLMLLRSSGRVRPWLTLHVFVLDQQQQQQHFPVQNAVVVTAVKTSKLEIRDARCRCLCEIVYQILSA